MRDFTLKFPCELKRVVGLNEKEINSFKGKGCRFYGRKTSAAWIIEYLNKITAVSDENAPLSRHQRKAASKSGGSALRNGSPTASIPTH